MKNILLTCILFFTAINVVVAQNPAPPAAFEIYTTILNSNSQPSVADLLAGTASIQNDSADYSLRVVITLLDTINISNIHLSIGDSLGTTNLYNSNISFSNLNLSNQYREGNLVYIETATLNNLGGIYGNVYLEDVNGNFSSIVSFTSN